MGDAIFAEPELGTRPNDCLERWVGTARNILGSDCINQKKVEEEEGEWSTRSVILRFVVDTEAMTIEVPPIKVESAALFVLSEEFGSPYVRLRLKSLQTIRGLMTHLVNASLFWKSCVQPVDAMLSCQYESAEYVSRPDPEEVSAFLPMMAMLKYLANDRAVWRTLFRGEIARVLETHLRFTNPQDCSNSVWLTGDAIPQVVSAINWGDKQFAKVAPCGLLKEFSG